MCIALPFHTAIPMWLGGLWQALICHSNCLFLNFTVVRNGKETNHLLMIGSEEKIGETCKKTKAHILTNAFDCWNGGYQTG